jgi:hypothetical protein
MLFKAKRAQGGSGTASLIRVHPCSSVVKEKGEPKIAGRLRFIRKHLGNGICWGRWSSLPALGRDDLRVVRCRCVCIRQDYQLLEHPGLSSVF